MGIAHKTSDVSMLRFESRHKEDLDSIIVRMVYICAHCSYTAEGRKLVPIDLNWCGPVGPPCRQCTITFYKHSLRDLVRAFFFVVFDTQFVASNYGVEIPISC